MKSYRKKILEPVAEVYKPSFEIPENMVMGIGDKKIGQGVKLIVNFNVIEKTKNYTIIQANNMTLVTSRRTY